MNRKLVGCALGVLGLFVWFLPFAYVDFMGQTFVQSGQHIGGIAYLMLLAFAAYAVLSWLELHGPRMIGAGAALAVALLFLAQAGGSAAWGLYVAIVVSALSLWFAYRDSKTSVATA